MGLFRLPAAKEDGGPGAKSLILKFFTAWEALTRQETSPSHRAIYRDRAKVVGLQNRFQRKRCRTAQATLHRGG